MYSICYTRTPVLLLSTLVYSEVALECLQSGKSGNLNVKSDQRISISDEVSKSCWEWHLYTIQSRKQISSQGAQCYLKISFLPYFDPNYSFTAKIDIFQVSPYCPYCQKAQNCKFMLDIWLTIPLSYFLCFPPSFSFCQVFHSN